MYVWFVTIFDGDEIADRGEPFISPQKAMSDICYRHLNWTHVEMPKFGGAVLEHWQATEGSREYVLDKEHVIGSEDC